MAIYRFIPMLLAGLLAAPALAQVSPAAALAAHNAERQNYPGVGPLQWSPELAEYAQAWADTLATRDVGQHRPFTTDNPLAPGQPAGENLFWGYGLPYTVADAVQSWVAEKQWYHHDLDNGYGGWNQPPGCTPPANEPFCGHFTQVIWRDTQYVGCGQAQASAGARTTYIVCNYYPAGNFAGQRPY
jgi:pathogenesis-related protein 1